MQARSVHSKTHYDPSGSKPEVGLAEWTDKIKALQRQVDADEEAEQKSLQEEIAASRLARLRRSHGIRYSGGTDNSEAPMVNDNGKSPYDEAGIDATKTISERQSNQAEALQRLTGNESITTIRPVENVITATSTDRASMGTKSQPISLGAFMGGRATGPRLNKHAPQQDVHDPTQFQQRKFNHVPHPTFGTGGIAMPGMANTSVTLSKPTTRTPEIPPIIKTHTEMYEVPHGPDIRKRTTSTPSSWTSGKEKKAISTVPSDFHLSTARKMDQDVGKIPSLSKPVSQPTTSLQQSKSPIATPYLTRHTNPELPRALSSSPALAPPVPSKAFSRPPPQKELTPSISRLQGRGFVQNMVKVSSQLESPPAPVVETPEKIRPGGGRHSSVLNRWQPNMLSTTPSPSTSPTPRIIRRSITVDHPSAIAEDTSKAVNSGDHLRERTSLPSLRQGDTRNLSPAHKFHQPKNTPPEGLGSATTLIVYKPAPVQTPNVDELGFRHQDVSKDVVPKLPSPSRHPLSHPTKGRARKPRKMKNLGSDSQSANTESTNISGSQSFSVQSVPMMLQNRAPESSIVKATGHMNDVLERVTPQADDDANIENPMKGLILPGVTAFVPLTGQVETKLISSGPPDKEQATSQVPGVTEPESTLQLPKRLDEMAPSLDNQPPKHHREIPTQAPFRHPRIPTTGNRATVMDVAQALVESEKSLRNIKESLTASDSPKHDVPSVQAPILSSVHTEKRRSSYERYSSIILPPLEEETTPTPSPSVTISRKGMDTLSHVNIFPPGFNVDLLLESRIKPVAQDKESITISVEVMSITGTTASMLSQSRTVFYDTEILAIIHRCKSRRSGLVSTTVLGWEGKRAILGEREQRKLQELAKHYGATPNIVYQNSEPPELVHILGGVLAIRQGPRTHWTPENTAMHLVRSQGDVIFIDEKDLSIKNLCSAFSYCVSILGSVYIWYGRGSTTPEKHAALEYGRSLTSNALPIELSEDGQGDDEMFWMIMGDEEYANADYWKWRSNSSIIDPRIWRVESGIAKSCATLIDYIANETRFHDSIYIIDCVWELYVMVGCNARGHKENIQLALHMALELSGRVSSARPYTPNVHVIILPSQLPRDLRLNFRDLDEFSVNNGEIPDHMNVLSSTDAADHLRKSHWDIAFLKNHTMLPLGVDTSHLS